MTYAKESELYYWLKKYSFTQFQPSVLKGITSKIHIDRKFQIN